MNVECTSTLEGEPGDTLTAGLIRPWLADLPNGATVSAIMRDYGTQRDPVPTLVGLRAKWSESR